MKNPREYAEELAEKTGSYYKAAKLLNITIQSLTRIRDGETIPKDSTCIEIAKVLEVDEKEVLFSAAIARSGENKELRKVWESISKASGIAASFFLTFQILSPIDVFKSAVEYILC